MQCVHANTNIISQHTHTQWCEVEVYSVNKLKFWAMDKNVVGKKKFAGRAAVSAAVKTERVNSGCMNYKWTSLTVRMKDAFIFRK